MTAQLFYVLLDGKPVLADVAEWAGFLDHMPRQNVIAHQYVNGVSISTIFVGIDTGNGPYFETMIFGGIYDRDQWRYPDIERAKAGHEAAVKLVESYENAQ